jgi:hypothetical protein
VISIYLYIKITPENEPKEKNNEIEKVLESSIIKYIKSEKEKINYFEKLKKLKKNYFQKKDEFLKIRYNMRKEFKNVDDEYRRKEESLIYNSDILKNKLKELEKKIQDLEIYKKYRSRRKKIRIWASDYHSAPIMDFISITTLPEFPYDVDFIVQSPDYEYCKFFTYKGNSFCSTDTRIRKIFSNIWQFNHWEIKEQFFKTYINETIMQTVDAFVCSLPPGMCQSFMGFNKSLIVTTPVNFLFARGQEKVAKDWFEDLKIISENPMNTIVANNRYHQYQGNLFTKLPFKFIPSLCSYQEKFSFKPEGKKAFLISRKVSSLTETLNNMIKKKGFDFNIIGGGLLL